ncbi:MAG: hypothetical protein K9K76_08225 [Halanaerobiales bacterium]|nr:hypothetical protein [Halanaerobiales bacterium]
MNRNIKTIIDDFILKMFGSQQSGKELEENIKKENKNLIQNIIDYMIDKFDFLNTNN